MIKKFIVFCCLLISFILVIGFSFNLKTKALSYNTSDFIYTKYSFDVELTLDTGDIINFHVDDCFDNGAVGYQIRNDYGTGNGFFYLIFDTVVIGDFLNLNLYEGRVNTGSNSYYFSGSDVVSYKLFFNDILIVGNGFNNKSDYSFNELQISTYDYDVTYSAYYNLYNFREDDTIHIEYFSVENEKGSTLTWLPIFNSTSYGAMVGLYGCIPVSSLEVHVINDTVINGSPFREFSLMLPIIEPNFTNDLIVYENVYDSLSFFVNKSVYGFYPLENNPSFTSWISTAVSGFLSPEIIPGVSIGGILLVCISIPLLLAFLKFFAGG